MILKGPIGIFDSGYGGLTVMKEIVRTLPQYDYIYLGDNARAPYGDRSFETIYRYTLQCVKWFFEQNCSLVILACNTASAKALRTIQQKDLPLLDPARRVLGVIRPTTETIGTYSNTGEIGILATQGTVHSASYTIEIKKFYPNIKVAQEACPMWVPLIENNEHNSEGADYFIKKNTEALLAKNRNIDTVLLACTHYPLIKKKLEKYLPSHIKIISQGEIVANSLKKYLVNHPEIEARITQHKSRKFYTTDSTEDFDNHSAIFYNEKIESAFVSLP